MFGVPADPVQPHIDSICSELFLPPVSSPARSFYLRAGSHAEADVGETGPRRAAASPPLLAAPSWTLSAGRASPPTSSLSSISAKTAYSNFLAFSNLIVTSKAEILDQFSFLV